MQRYPCNVRKGAWRQFCAELTCRLELVEYGGKTLACRKHDILVWVFPKDDTNKTIDNLLLMGDGDLTIQQTWVPRYGRTSRSDNKDQEGYKDICVREWLVYIDIDHKASYRFWYLEKVPSTTKQTCVYWVVCVCLCADAGVRGVGGMCLS